MAPKINTSIDDKAILRENLACEHLSSRPLSHPGCRIICKMIHTLTLIDQTDHLTSVQRSRDPDGDVLDSQCRHLESGLHCMTCPTRPRNWLAAITGMGDGRSKTTFLMDMMTSIRTTTEYSCGRLAAHLASRHQVSSVEVLTPRGYSLSKMCCSRTALPDH